jgi:hypothetical protein
MPIRNEFWNILGVYFHKVPARSRYPPSTFTITPSPTYENPIVAAEWSGTVAGSSPIKLYIIQKSTSEDQTTWTDYVTATQKVTTALSGTANLTAPNTRGTYIRFRIAVQDSLDAITDYVVSNIVRHTLIPNTPALTAPLNMGKCYNTNPRLLIGTGGSSDGHTQQLQVRVGATWYNTVDNPDMFSVSGLLVNGLKTIFRMPMSAGSYAITLRSVENSTTQPSPIKTFAFTILASPFTTIQAGQCVIATDIQRIRTAVNTLQQYYEITPTVWKEAIVVKQTKIRNWTAHITEIRTAIMSVITKINRHDTVTTFDVQQFAWIPIEGGRPRADIMNEIQDLLLAL